MDLLCKCGVVLLDQDIDVFNRCNELGEDYCEINAVCSSCGKEYLGLTEWGHMIDSTEVKQSLADYYIEELTIKERI